MNRRKWLELLGRKNSTLISCSALLCTTLPTKISTIHSIGEETIACDSPTLIDSWCATAVSGSRSSSERYSSVCAVERCFAATSVRFMGLRWNERELRWNLTMELTWNAPAKGSHGGPLITFKPFWIDRLSHLLTVQLTRKTRQFQFCSGTHAFL